MTAATRGTWEPGEVILDLYEVLPVLEAGTRRLAYHSGGMGLVYRVRHLGWNVELALKVPRDEWFERERQRVGFEEEAERWVSLGAHPHVVTCHYVRRLERRPCVFADYVVGGNLTAWLSRGEHYRGGRMASLAAVLDMAIQVAWGLDHAHRHGVVHQDVKPDNVLVEPDGRAHVADFGLARARAATSELPGEGVPGRSVVVPGAGARTPAYASPEQLGHTTDLTRATDVWSWAVSVLELFCGERRWDAGREAPRVLARRRRERGRVPLPAVVAQLLERCFDYDPAERPHDLVALAADLKAAYAESTGGVYPREEPEPAALLADGLSNRALSLLDLGRVQDAEATWAQALRADPQHPQATYNHGLHLMRIGQLSGDELVRRIEAVRASHPDAWVDEYLLGLVHLERGDPAAAKAMLTSAYLVAPDDPEIAVALAQVEAASNSPAEVRAPWSYAQPATTRMLRSAERAVAGARSTALELASAGRFRDAGAVLTDARRTAGWRRHPEIVDAWRAIASHGRRRALADAWSAGTLEGHVGPVATIAVSDDGRRAMTSGGADRTLRLWDVGTRSCRRVLNDDEPVAALALSSDGRLGLSAGGEPAVQVWDVEAGTCVRVLTGHAAPVTGVALTPDGRFALAGSADGALRLWDVASGACLRSIGGDGARLASVAVTTDARRAVSGGDAVHAWDLAAGVRLRTLGDDAPRATAPVALTDNGALCVSGHSDGEIRLWTIDSDDVHKLRRGGEAVRALAITPGGEDVVTDGHGRALVLWNRTAGVRLRTLDDHAGTVCAAAISADAGLIVSGDAAGAVHLWALDWNIDFFDAADWYTAADKYLHAFLRAHAPWPSDDRSLVAWTDDDFTALLRQLRYAGYGWLRPAGVRERLEWLAALPSRRS